MAVGALAGGGAISASSQILGGIAANNAAQRQAQLLKLQGRFDAKDMSKESAELASATRARSENPNTGSSLDIQLSQAFEAENRLLKHDFGIKTQASAIRDQGRAALVGGIVGAAGSLLGASGAAASFSGPAAQVRKPLQFGSSTNSTSGNSHLMRFGNTA